MADLTPYLTALGGGLVGSTANAWWTRRQENNRRRHEQAKHDRHAAAAALLVFNDLGIARLGFEQALKARRWTELSVPTEAWRQHGVEVVSLLKSRSEVKTVSETCSRLETMTVLANLSAEESAEHWPWAEPLFKNLVCMTLEAQEVLRPLMAKIAGDVSGDAGETLAVRKPS